MALRREAFGELQAKRETVARKLEEFVPISEGSWVEQWKTAPIKSAAEHRRIEAERVREAAKRREIERAEAERQAWLLERGSAP